MNPFPRKSTLVADVIHELREWILTGKIQPGEFLSPRKELAAQFGVGLSTIHEAVQALAVLGLVESHPGKGTWVRQDALESLIHPAVVENRLGELNTHSIYEARSVIEVALTELAAERATPEDMERIWNALEAMKAAGQDEIAFVEADFEFHLAVAKAGHSDLLERFYHLSRRLFSKVIAGLVLLPKVKEESIRFQQAIAQAIEQRDPHQARRVALDHVRYVGRLLNISRSRVPELFPAGRR